MTKLQYLQAEKWGSNPSWITSKHQLCTTPKNPDFSRTSFVPSNTPHRAEINSHILQMKSLRLGSAQCAVQSTQEGGKKPENSPLNISPPPCPGPQALPTHRTHFCSRRARAPRDAVRSHSLQTVERCAQGAAIETPRTDRRIPEARRSRGRGSKGAVDGPGLRAGARRGEMKGGLRGKGLRRVTGSSRAGRPAPAARGRGGCPRRSRVNCSRPRHSACAEPGQPRSRRNDNSP